MPKGYQFKLRFVLGAAASLFMVIAPSDGLQAQTASDDVPAQDLARIERPIAPAIANYLRLGIPLESRLPGATIRLGTDIEVQSSRLVTGPDDISTILDVISALGPTRPPIINARIDRILRQIADETASQQHYQQLGIAPRTSQETIVETQRALGRHLAAQEVYDLLTPAELVAATSGLPAPSAPSQAVEDARSLVQAAEAATRQGDFATAREKYDEALRAADTLSPNDAADIRLSYAFFLSRTAGEDEARAALEKVVTDDLSANNRPLYDALQTSFSARAELAQAETTARQSRPQTASTVTANSPRQVAPEPTPQVAEAVARQAPVWSYSTKLTGLSGVVLPTVVDPALSVQDRGNDLRFDGTLSTRIPMQDFMGGRMNATLGASTFQYADQRNLSFTILNAGLDWQSTLNGQNRNFGANVALALNDGLSTRYYTEISLTAGANWRYSETTGAGFTARLSHTDYATNPGQDQTRLGIFPFYRQLGFMGLPWRMDLSGALQWTEAEKAAFSNVATSASAQFTRPINDAVQVYGLVGAEFRQYLGNDTIETTKRGQDIALTIGAGVNYRLSERTVLSVGATLRDQASNIARRDARSASLFIGVNGAF